MKLRLRTMRGMRWDGSWSLLDLLCLLFILCTLAGPRYTHAGVIPYFVQEPESAYVAHHSSVKLYCVVEPHTAQVRWLFNGEPLDPATHKGLRILDNVLHFTHFSHGSNSSGNDGEYRCTASTDAGTIISRPAALSKPVLRKFPSRQNITISVVEGGYATLPCTSPESYPPANMDVVTASGHPLDYTKDTVQKLPSGSVVLLKLRLEDSGSYRCVATNPLTGTNRTSHHLIMLQVIPSGSGGVQEQKTVIVDTESSPSLQVTTGQSIVLECPTAGVSAPVVTWSKYAGDVTGRARTEFGNLYISSVEHRDGGTYICRTDDGLSRMLQLGVQTPPLAHISTGEEKRTAGAGETVTLSCNFSGYPAPNVMWFHNGNLIRKAKILMRGDVSSLYLEKVSTNDAGIYSCEVSNLLGHVSAVFYVGVRQVGSSVESDASIASTGTTLIKKDIEDAVPGTILTDLDVDQNIKVEEDSTGRDQTGNGRKRKNKRKNRRKKNKGRQISSNRGLAKKVKLIPPSRPTVSRLSDTSVMISWTVPENDGLPITFFRVQYKEVKPTKGRWRTLEKDIDRSARRYEVSKLKPGGTYKFRIAAVYSNNDNKMGRNSRHFHLNVIPHPEPRPPDVSPMIVEAEPIFHEEIYGIGIKWQFQSQPSTTIDGFNIFYKPFHAPEDHKVVTLRAGGVTQHMLTDLKADTEYSITMKCYNSAGSSQFGNTVVKRTLPIYKLTVQPEIPPVATPEDEDKTPAPPPSHRGPGGLDQPVILGIVLGIMLLLLVVFIAMCWWKQRQQKRRNLGANCAAKFQDQSQRIYMDSLQKKHPNGTAYPLNGLNGVVLANGHGPHGQHKMNLDVQAQTDVDSQLNSWNRRSGKMHHHGNGYPNGVIPGYGHVHSNDSNFNKIHHTASSDSVRGLTGMVPKGNNLKSPARDMNGGIHLPRTPYSHRSKSSISSFGPHQHHPGSCSPHSDSSAEEEPLTTGKACSVYPCLDSEQGVEGYQHKYCQIQKQAHSSHGSFRDSGDEMENEHLPCYRYDMATVYGLLLPENNVGAEVPNVHCHGSSSLSSSSRNSKPKRRRKRSHSGGREHATRDQATNTDLSSNEGTIEFTTFSKSPSSSVSTSNSSENCQTISCNGADMMTTAQPL